MTLLAPASYYELEEMLEQAVLRTSGTVAVRYPRGGQGAYREHWNGRDEAVLRTGRDVTIVTYGILINQALEAGDRLAQMGYDPEIIKLNTLAPLMWEAVGESVEKTRRLVIIEDCLDTGSVGQQLCARLVEHGICPERVIRKNTGDQYTPQGTVQQLWHSLGLDADGIVRCVCEVCDG